MPNTPSPPSIHLGCALAIALIALGAVSTILGTSTAHAAPSKKARKAKAVPATGEASAPLDEAKGRSAPARFEWSGRGEDVDMDARADKKRDEAIGKLERLLPSVGDGPQKGELIFRLAEMYWTKSKYLNLTAMRQWDRALEAWYQAGSKGEQPKLDDIPESEQSAVYRREALQLYDRILAEYPRYPRKDEVLYNLASSLYDTGKKNEGVKMYWTLIKQVPDSDYVADAWLALGEHFFNANKLPEAIKAYSRAVETKKPRIYSFALYKLAWCDYNLQEYEKALEKFQSVVAYARGQAQIKTKGENDLAERDRIQLQREALNDLVRVYSHLDAVDDAVEYYVEQVGEEDSYAYLHRLATLYNKEGKSGLEIATYRLLNERAPYAALAPANQAAIVNAYAHLDRKEDVRREVRRLIDLYSPGGPWARKNAENERVLAVAFERVETELAALVTEQHRAAQQTKLTDTYLLARDLYKEYLDKFADTENAYSFRFFYAEILYELRELEAAAEAYVSVVRSDKKGKFAKDAAYAAVLAWEKVAAGVKEEVGRKIVEGRRGKSKGALEKLERLEKLKKGSDYTPEPLSTAEVRLAEACDLFAEVAPQDDEVLKIKFKSARLYYIHNQFEEAARRFGELIDMSPRDRLARLGAESILTSFAVREDWSQLNAWARKFAANTALVADREFSKTVSELMEGASFNEIHFVYEPKESPEQIANRYRAFVHEFPRSKLALVALYNAAVSYDKANLLEKALETGALVLDQYADFRISQADLEQSKKDGAQLPAPAELREKVLFMQASFYERLAEFERAADLYERYVREFPKGPKVADALFNAGLFREGLGQYDQAIANFRAYIEGFPRKNDVPDLAWRIGTILEKKSNRDAVAEYYDHYAARYGTKDRARKLCAEHKALEARLASGREKEPRRGYLAIVEGYSELKAADKLAACPLEAVAQASFRLVEPEFDAYVAIDLSGSEREMAKKLMRKLEMVGSLQQRYTKVLGLGQGDYGIASLYRIGFIYQHLAQAIFATPCPKRLDEDQCGIYQAALQEQAFPLEEKAIEAFDKALQKAHELGLYNEWLAKTQAALATYEPTRFPDVQTFDLIAGEGHAQARLVEVKQ